MALKEFLMPKMGESITEATIISWSKSIGDRIDEDETLLEIATDKVDSDLPSPFKGKVVKILFEEGDTVAVGAVIAIIEIEEGAHDRESSDGHVVQIEQEEKTVKSPPVPAISLEARPSSSKRFYSPLVRTIAELEQLSITELDTIKGTGADGRVSKKDVVAYVQKKSLQADKSEINYMPLAESGETSKSSYSGEVEIIEMDRMRRLIADHMVRSKHTAPHVTSFLEIDVTNLVEWRNRIKDTFLSNYREKITFTPIFLEAIVRAIQDFPGVNASVEGHKMILKKYINVGMATATPSGNLIVPVLKNADQMSLQDIVRSVNDLSQRARTGRLQPQEVQDGTFTLTNVGTFGNTMGTPIINQPQVAILSTGAIKKKPAVVETEQGDQIVVRQFMFLSLSYDHRIVDGALGGQFLRRVGDYLENFDIQRTI